jgi:hypothetical protein
MDVHLGERFVQVGQEAPALDGVMSALFLRGDALLLIGDAPLRLDNMAIGHREMLPLPVHGDHVRAGPTGPSSGGQASSSIEGLCASHSDCSAQIRQVEAMRSWAARSRGLRAASPATRAASSALSR